MREWRAEREGVDVRPQAFTAFDAEQGVTLFVQAHAGKDEVNGVTHSRWTGFKRNADLSASGVGNSKRSLRGVTCPLRGGAKLR
jgi:hypothetical protein